MARIEFPVWTVTRAVLAMPFRNPLALVRFGLLPLLIAMICFPPAINVSSNTDTTVDGRLTDRATEMLSVTDNELGWRDLIGFVLMLPFAAAFAAAWNRLTATGQESEMGRAPIAFDGRTILVIWSFLQLLLVVIGLGFAFFVVSLFFFGSYHDGTFSYSYSYNVTFTGIGQTLGMVAVVLAIGCAIAWFMMRFALVIPASAMGEPISLKQSWRLTRPVQFRLTASATLLTIVFLLLNLLFSFVMALMMGTIGTQATFYASVVLYFPLQVYAHAIWAGLLGASYGLLQASGAIEGTAKVFD